VSRAPERRIVFSKRRERRVSASEGREGSIEGESIGESSVVMMKRPSKGRSGKGVVTSAVMWVWILEGGVSGLFSFCSFVNAQVVEYELEICRSKKGL
jgi:hypothetical protein